MAIMITQWLCPNRHALIAAPWDTKEITEKEVVEDGEKTFGPGLLDRKCGICHSADILPESAPSRFTSLQQCTEAMRDSQIEQIASRVYLESVRDQRN